MNDGQYTEIQDQNFSEKAREALGEVEVVSKDDVKAARDKMWKAAKEAAERAGNEIRGLDGDGEKKKLVDEYKDTVYKKFKYTYERDIEMPENMAEILKSGRKELSEGQMSGREYVHGIVTGKWSGEAQRSFSRYFLSPFGTAVSHQQAIFEEMITALTAYEAVLRAARTDAKQLADECAAYMELLTVNGKSPDQITSSLKAFGISLKIVSALTSTIPGVDMALGLAKIGADATTKNHEDMAKEANSASSSFEFTGHQPDMVLDELIGALDNLKLAMDEEEKFIGKGLRTSLSEMEDRLTSKNPFEKSTILPSEPDDKEDDTADLTDGEKPDDDKFEPS